MPGPAAGTGPCAVADRSGGGVLGELEALRARVARLEALRAGGARGAGGLARDAGACAATDAFAVWMGVRAVAAGFRRTRFVRCAADYYAQPLDARRRFLGAASTGHLTKSLVLQNTRHEGPHSGASLAAAEFVCVVVQYGRRVDADALASAVDAARAAQRLPPQRRRAYRLAADCEAVTGYEPNAVTPLGIRTPMPVLVDQRIADLVPGTFWLGGGEVSLKWRVEWEEFRRIFNPLVAPVSSEED